MGGEGSGRKPSEATIIERMKPQEVPVGTGVYIPNYSGLQAVKKTDPTITASGHTIQDEGSNLTQRTNLNFSGSGVLAVDNAAGDVTTINISAGAGETNTASNVGTGEQVFKTKSGVDLQFKTITAGTNITLTSGANSFEIASSGGTGGSQWQSGAGYIYPEINAVISGAGLIAGTISGSKFISGSTPLSASGHTHIEADITNLQTYALNSQFQIVSGAQVVLSGSHTSLSGAYYVHTADTSDPHGITLYQTNTFGTTLSGNNIIGITISGTRARLSGDNTISGTGYVPMILFGTNITPPTASNFPQGSIYFRWA